MNSDFREIIAGTEETSGDKRNVYIYSLAGKKLYPLDPDYSEANITLDDISVSLARTCKFNGLSTGPYSMAKHSLLVAEVIRYSLAGRGKSQQFKINKNAQALYGLFMSSDVSVFGMRSSLHFNSPAELAVERMEWVNMIWKKFIRDANPHIQIPDVDFNLIQSAKNIVLIAERQVLLNIADDADRIDVLSAEIEPVLNMTKQTIFNMQNMNRADEEFKSVFHALSSDLE